MRPRLRQRGFTWIELLICIALGVLVVAILVPTLTRPHETAGRVRCASNLRQIGQAMLLYANENRQQWPRTIWDPDNPTPTQFTGHEAANPFLGGGPQPNDVTAALYLLVRTQDIGTEVFTSPADNAEKWDLGGKAATRWSNFPSTRHLSFSLANPYPTRALVDDSLLPEQRYRWTANVNPEFAVAADANPGSPKLLTITPQSDRRDMKECNSVAHDGDGQDVLFGDGHTEFVTTPFVGVGEGQHLHRRTEGRSADLSATTVRRRFRAVAGRNGAHRRRLSPGPRVGIGTDL